MVKDEQVRILMKLINQERTVELAAAKAGLSEKTARKYRKLGKLPSQVQAAHTWRTREDPFEADWPWIEELLEYNQGLEAKTILEALQRRKPGKYQDGQLRTLQRRIKYWRATQGPAREVFFPQTHHPGRLAESDFTRMGSLGVTINGAPFDHMIYHFVLTYSNWETGTVCFSESFESLSVGLQNALWQLGGVPQYHRTDNLSAAVHPVGDREEFTDAYRALANHYGFSSEKIQPQCPHEDGDVEQRHYRFKRAVEQSLILRGSRDFTSRQEYETFLGKLFTQLNAGRQERLREELKVLRELPSLRLGDYRSIDSKVGQASTIRVLKNSYSVHSRLVGETVRVRIYAESLEVWYGQRQIEDLPRLRGENGYYINYRHIIDWLVRKPGAFENYRYKQALFPSSQFRMAYDLLRQQHGVKVGNKQYLKLLELAAKESETVVNETLRFFLHRGIPLTFEAVEAKVRSCLQPPSVTSVHVEPADLQAYDRLLDFVEALTPWQTVTEIYTDN
jgi:hypothetical protein